jgi:hypothetical protein
VIQALYWSGGQYGWRDHFLRICGLVSWRRLRAGFRAARRRNGSGYRLRVAAVAMDASNINRVTGTTLTLNLGLQFLDFSF